MAQRLSLELARPRPDDPVLVAAYDDRGAIRTSGVLVCAGTSATASAVATAIASLAEMIPAPATGKIVVAQAGVVPRLAVFQQVAGVAVPAWCGNVSGAGLVALGRSRAQLCGPDGATAIVEVSSSPPFVSQRWRFLVDGGIEPPRATPAATPMWYSATLNRYRIILAPVEAVDDVAPPSPTTKTAIVEAGDPAPRVRFHTGQRWHGAAPLTGLVELVVAARCEPALANALGDSGAVVLPDGRVEPLPAVVVDGETVVVDFARRRYELLPVGGDVSPSMLTSLRGRS